MNPYLGVLLLIGLLVVSWRFMRPRQRGEKSERPRRPERKVEGFHVWSPLYVRMGRGCIQDYGMQFGQGFRRKEGPLLPHDPHCRCETLPFSFTSSEVFAGALRRVSEPKSLEPGLPAEAVPKLMAALKRINAEPVPPDADAYIATIGADSLDAGTQSAALAFLRERHGFLTGTPPSPPASNNRTDPAEGASLAAPAVKNP
jgi:hypothetical protein